MNYRDPELRDALAAEYVLGTLRGQARRRFQTLMMQFPSLRESTWLWEQHLHGMNERLAPIEPDQAVWQHISQRLGFTLANADTRVATDKTNTVHEQSSESLKQPQSNVVSLSSFKTRLWQGAASFATAAAIILAVVLVKQQSIDIPVAQQVAVVQGAESQALWLIEVTDNSIEVRSTSNFTPLANKDYELWMIAKGIENPISLGLLPKSGQLSLPKDSQFDAVDIVALAVSLEPLNGSPNGLPTEVLYTAELAVL
ncbi:anti-sigma factor [Shewanella ulleungensis]|uniref:Anti-sigma K factor RskA n=1 Tax=Shewanella ulleungensis TaxID=2282699 RepID=A0ABQ2QQD2_9GAMM|nr:anti-sigma factor [Shewanella ulleungensis]MCL1151548.1 anti-sigma factor [Shewanella ulleungensis]GGP89503.1 anti-sigma K factor RskA [Shewanella ulleungensis]